MIQFDYLVTKPNELKYFVSVQYDFRSNLVRIWLQKPTAKWTEQTERSPLNHTTLIWKPVTIAIKMKSGKYCLDLVYQATFFTNHAIWT